MIEQFVNAAMDCAVHRNSRAMDEVHQFCRLTVMLCLRVKNMNKEIMVLMMPLMLPITGCSGQRGVWFEGTDIFDIDLG